MDPKHKTSEIIKRIIDARSAVTAPATGKDFDQMSYDELKAAEERLAAPKAKRAVLKTPGKSTKAVAAV